MKPRLLEELKKEYDAVHGCYRPADGPCFYIASAPAAGDYGRRKGRRFVAALEDRDGTLHPRISLTFLVGTMAQLAKGDLIGDLDEFCLEVGLEKLGEALDHDYKTDRDEEIVLTRESDDSLFRRPASGTAIRKYQALKNQILHLLADRHARGTKRVLTSALLEGLCDDPRLINRALNELVELNLLRDLNHSDGMRLTAEGQKSAEVALTPEQVPNGLITSASPMGFDLFISYASEDRDVAEALDKALSARGYRVWRDRGQLTLGDSLTAKINEGLAASRFGIVILSQAFLRKNWPQAELNALQARAISAGQKVILPIRRNLAHEEMARHLPLLGDKLTMAFDGNLDQVIEEIERAVKSQVDDGGKNPFQAVPLSIPNRAQRYESYSPDRHTPAPAAATAAGDASKFVRDVTIPDGSSFKIGEEFEKIWEIQNVGSVVWRNRFLRREGASSGSGLITSPEKVAIPETHPAQTVQISVPIKAPNIPTTTTAIWKMVDQHGNKCFPGRYRHGLTITINVIE